MSKGVIIMSKQLTEAQVLEKLNIPDFRHLSKDNVMSFASMIQDMDPEVAKKALEQFPDFAKSTMDALKDIKSVIDKSFEDDKESDFGAKGKWPRHDGFSPDSTAIRNSKEGTLRTVAYPLFCNMKRLIKWSGIALPVCCGS